MSPRLRLFCSYAHEDEKLRAKLETHLKPLMRDGDIEIWDDGDITGGREWDAEIKEQLNQAHIILLLISPDFLASDYIHAVEVTNAMAWHEAREARVIPIILRPCAWEESRFGKLQALPEYARPVTLWPNEDEAFLSVLKGIRRAIDELNANRGPQPVQPTEVRPLPTRASIPRPPAVGFVSRRDERGRDILERLKEELAPGRGRLIALWGPGGSGKSTLAAELARALRPTFNDRLAWVSALGRADFSLSTLLDDIATQLGNLELRTLAPAAKEEQVRALVSASPALVVLDNFETINPEEQMACAAFLAGCGECPALITTRVEVDGARNIRLAAMEMDEARELLRRLIEDAAKPSAFVGLAHDELISGCEANPLVMQWVVRQIKLALRPQDALRDLGQGHSDAAQRVFDRSFNLDLLGNDGRAALLALSLFAPDASHEALAATAGFGDDLPRLNKTIADLSSLWLIETTERNERLLLRGLTRQLAKSRLTQDNRAPIYRQQFVTYFLVYAEAHRQTTAEDFNSLEAEKDNLIGAQNVAFEGQDWLGVVRIQLALDGFLHARGYWGEAVNTGEQALHAARLSQRESAVAIMSHNLAVTYQRRGELTDAQRFYGDSLEIARRLGDQRGVAITLHQLAILAHDAGELDEARRLYGESLEIKQKLGDQSGVAKSLHQMGWLAQGAGDYEEARQLYGKSLEVSRGLGDQTGVARTLHQLAMLAHDAGELDEARRLYGESLEIKQKLGDQSGVSYTLHQLAILARRTGDNEEARRLYGESLEIDKRHGDQSGISISLHALANLLRDEGNLSEARLIYEKSLEITKKLGDKSNLALIFYNLGLLAEKEGDKTEAARLLKDSVSIFEELGSPRAEVARRNLERITGESS